MEGAEGNEGEKKGDEENEKDISLPIVIEPVDEEGESSGTDAVNEKPPQAVRKQPLIPFGPVRVRRVPRVISFIDSTSCFIFCISSPPSRSLCSSFQRCPLRSS